MSPSWLPVITSSSSAASATVRASGPSMPSPNRSGTSGAEEILPRVGLIPNSPHTLDGIRIDPPPSLRCGDMVALAGDVAGVDERTERLPDPGDHVQVLDRNGHAGQRLQGGGVA